MATTKEQQILETVRKVLSAVVRDTTPNPGMRHPLTDQTIQDLRNCFALITAREQELAKQSGEPPSKSRPRYADEPQESTNEKVILFRKDVDTDHKTKN